MQNNNSIFTPSESARNVRTIFRLLAIALLISGAFAITGNSEAGEIAAFLGILLAFASASPFERVIERAFFPQISPHKIVRKNLKLYWVEDFLKTEEHAFVGLPPAEISQTNQEILSNSELQNLVRTHFGPFCKCEYLPSLKPYIISDDRGFKFDKNNPHNLIVDAKDTLPMIFDKFTRFVMDDDNVTGEFIILLGEQGSRKTIQLLKLAEALEKTDTRLPIYLNLFSWAAGCKPIEHWLREEICNYYDILPNQARSLIKTTYFILLLDGFEEIPRERRRHFIKALGSFLKNRGNSKSLASDEPPLDLRDSVVISCQLPLHWRLEGTLEEEIGYDPSILQPSDMYDLEIHLPELVTTLQEVGKKNEDAPVAVIYMKQFSDKQVRNFLKYHLKRKIQEKQSQFSPTSAIPLLKGVALDYKITETIKEIMRKPLLASILCKQPFLLRAFVTLSYYDPDDCKLNTPISDIDPDNQSDVQKKLRLFLKDKLQTYNPPQIPPAKPKLEEIRREEFYMILKSLISFRLKRDYGLLDLTDPPELLRKVSDEIEILGINEFQYHLMQIIPRFRNYYVHQLYLLQAKEIRESAKKLSPDELIKKFIGEKHISDDELRRFKHELIIFLLSPSKQNARTDADQLTKQLRNIKATNLRLDKAIEELPSNQDLAKNVARDGIRKMTEEIIGEIIIEKYVVQQLRRQPSNLGPSYRSQTDVDRKKLLANISQSMLHRRQRMINEEDIIFYQEESGLNLIMQQTQRVKDRYRSLVASLSMILFMSLFLLFIFAIGFINKKTLDSINLTTYAILAALMLIFSRNYGWISCGLPQDDQLRVSYPTRWDFRAGLSAALMMGAFVGIIFFEISQFIYKNLNDSPLRYETFIVGLFASALFLLIGGLDLGRRFPIIAHLNDGRRFLIISTILGMNLWTIFFFLFLLWPRTRFDILTEAQIEDLIPHLFEYAVVTGGFLGIISGLIFSHLYLRHIFLSIFLRFEYNLNIRYTQLFEHNAHNEVALLRKVGNGYLFRHRSIMNYFLRQGGENYD